MRCVVKFTFCQQKFKKFEKFTMFVLLLLREVTKERPMGGNPQAAM